MGAWRNPVHAKTMDEVVGLHVLQIVQSLSDWFLEIWKLQLCVKVWLMQQIKTSYPYKKAGYSSDGHIILSTDRMRSDSENQLPRIYNQPTNRWYQFAFSLLRCRQPLSLNLIGKTHCLVRTGRNKRLSHIMLTVKFPFFKIYLPVIRYYMTTLHSWTV